MEILTKETRQKRKRLQTHIGIMHNAKRLFEEKGLGKVTIEEITEAADISRSTFFSHFDSMDALISEIADIAVKDIIDAYKLSGKTGVEGVAALFDKLIEDSCPYPHFTVELFLNGIVKERGKTTFSDLEQLIGAELAKAASKQARYSRKEQTAMIIGAYFGTVFQKFLRGDLNWNPTDLKKSIRNMIINIIGE